MAVAIESANEKALNEIASNLLLRESLTSQELLSITKSVSSRYKLKALPKQSEILSKLPNEYLRQLSLNLKVKPVRTASGIAVIGVMARPSPCPHGTCIYCPGGVKMGTPQSYTGREPATMKALQNDYDPYRQVASRITQLRASGHNVEKIELVILGGTFMSEDEGYRDWFVKSCLDGLTGEKSATLDEAKKAAESSSIRNVGLTIETKPDYCKEPHIDCMLSYGATRVEIGVQALDDEIYKLVNRGHTLKDVVDAFRISRDSGFKIVAHMMPGLPGATPEEDLHALKSLFENSDYKPDMLKIYPTLVTEGTGLYRLWKKGKYEPYDLQTVINILAEAKRVFPRWLRVMRIQREIPRDEIKGGVDRGNLRELVLREVLRRGYECRCIRCREVGLKTAKESLAISVEHIRLSREDYDSSDGKEVFLSYEEVLNDVLIGFTRLRIPSEKIHRRELVGARCGLIRELHIYGPTVSLGSRTNDGWQHRGYGSSLLLEAEKIAREEFDAERMVVISAIGTRAYYRKLGYHLEGPYMVKPLK